MDKQKFSSEKDIFLKSQKRFCWKSDKIEVEELLGKNWSTDSSRHV